MHDDEDTLLRLATWVADETSVNWDRVRTDHAGLAGEIGILRQIESIGAAHRSLQAKRSPKGPGETWGHLQIVERIGQGGAGEIYRARDPMLAKEVALKLMCDRAGERALTDDMILEEAQRLARVRHRNVVTVYGAARHDDCLGLWMELIQGRTLEEIVKEQGPLGAEEAALVGADLCRALAAVHAAGLIHRDVKTANVMREAGGRIVLMDFSSVTEQLGVDDSGSRNPVGGTPVYMAPEVFRGVDSGARIDIYALGVVLYRLVSGRYPHEAEDLHRLAERHREGQPSRPLREIRPDLPVAFIRIVERALAGEPAARYDSVAEMERELSELSTPALTAPVTRRRFLPLAAAAMLVALVGGAFLMFRTPPFEVQSSLYRLRAGIEEPLTSGSHVGLGDRLFLEIEGSREMYVYVLNEDARGEAFTLFPLAELDLANPLPAGQRFRLPGGRAGVENYWDVTSRGGEELLLVVASVEPVGDVESLITTLQAAGSTPAEPSFRDIAGRRRGIGGLSPKPTVEEIDQLPLREIAQLLANRASGSEDIEVWELRLSNPGEQDGP